MPDRSGRECSKGLPTVEVRKSIGSAECGIRSAESRWELNYFRYSAFPTSHSALQYRATRRISQMPQAAMITFPIQTEIAGMPPDLARSTLKINNG